MKELSGDELSDRIATQNRIGASFSQHIHHRPVLSLATSPDNDFCSKTPSSEQPTEVVLFVGHGNVFRYWICRALQIPPEAWLRISLPHGSITELLVEFVPSWPTPECTVTALRVGDDGHIPVELQSR